MPGHGTTATFPASVFGHIIFLFFSFLQKGNRIELAVWALVTKELSVLPEVLELILVEDVIDSIDVVVPANRQTKSNEFSMQYFQTLLQSTAPKQDFFSSTVSTSINK